SSGGVQNLSFACNSNTGTNRMVGSFVLAQDFANVIGMETVVDLASASPSLPPWWTYLYSGSCRQGALSATFQADPGDPNCADWSSGQAVGGIGGYCTANPSSICGVAGQPANTARIKLVDAVPSIAPVGLTGGQEYVDFVVSITNIRTLGTGSC